MGKIALFFTFALLLYVIGKIVTDEWNVHQLTEYNDGDSLTSLATERNRDTITTLATAVNRYTVMASTTDINRDTVTTSSTDVDRDTLTTSSTDVSRDTVTTAATDVNTDTVTRLTTDINRDTVTTSTTGVNGDTVTSLTTDVNRDTITTSATDVDRDTVTTSASDVNGDTVTASATDVNRDTVTTSTTVVDRDTVTTSTTGVDRDTMTTSTTDVDRDTVTPSATDVDRDTVITLARDVNRETVTTSATDVDRDTVTTSPTDVDRDRVTTLTTDVNRDTIITSATNVDRDTVSTLTTDVMATISAIDADKNDLDAFTTPTLDQNEDRLLVRSVDSHTDAVTRPPAVNNTAIDLLTTTPNGDLRNCPDFVMVSCRQQCGVYRSLPCSCDQFCLIYKNCCPDYEMVCTQDAGILREYYSNLIDVDITCLESPTLDEYLGLQVISGCGVQASEESKRLCNPANMKPVTLDNTNLHFINIHCLICNGFNPSDVTRWNLQIVPHTIDLDLVTGGFEKLIKSRGFSVNPLPQSGIDLTYCCNKIIDHCDAPTTIEDKCSSSHSFYFKYGSERKDCLKNHFCAECNTNLYPDVCQWNEMDFAGMKTNLRVAFLIETGNKDKVNVTSYGTRNRMLWSSAECKSSMNDEFGVDITDCTLLECRRNIQLTNGSCLLENKIYCFVIVANLSLIDQDINVNKLSGLLSQQAIATLRQMNFILGSFNTTFNKRDQLLLCDLQFVNETFGVNAFKFREIYMPSVDIRLSKTGLSGNISICAEVNLLACSDTPRCAFYRSLEISPRPSVNKGSSKLISNYVLAIVVLMKFMAAIIAL